MKHLLDLYCRYNATVPLKVGSDYLDIGGRFVEKSPLMKTFMTHNLVQKFGLK